jgi:hypothetical protein
MAASAIHHMERTRDFALDANSPNVIFSALLRENRSFRPWGRLRAFVGMSGLERRRTRMKSIALMAVLLVTTLWAVPAMAQAPQANSVINGNVITNNLTAPGTPQTDQLTATAIINSWVSKVTTGVGSLVSGLKPTNGLFGTSSTTGTMQAMSPTVSGPFACPNPEQMTNQQWMNMFHIRYLQVRK